VELLGSSCIAPLQFLDDLTAACPSLGALRAVLSDEHSSACSRYAKKAKAAFNHGPDKTAAMALFNAPLASEESIGVGLVETYRLLGILVDYQLTFKPYLLEVCRKGRAIFQELFHAGETAGFSVPLLASQVTCRTVPQVMYGAALLVLVPTAVAALNRLQAYWARILLGGPPGFRLATLPAIAACGWTQSLGSLAWEAAIIAFARFFVLPHRHPGTLILELIRDHSLSDWASLVLDYMSQHHIPIITEAGFDAPLLEDARENKTCRKSLLRRYRWDCVKPKLLAQDAATFASKSARIIPTFGVPLSAFLPQLGRLPITWLSAPHQPGMWKFFRCWSLTRLTGRWPCSVLGSPDLPYTLETCPWCSAVEITVLHPFSACHKAAEHWAPVARDTQTGRPTDQSISIQLFGDCSDPVELWQLIAVVGAVLTECIVSSFGLPLERDDDFFSCERLSKLMASDAQCESHKEVDSPASDDDDL
jgi:hypothetical protein